MGNAYLVYNPYGLSYMSSLDTAHPLWNVKQSDAALKCMERGMCAYLTQGCARKIARKDGNVADTIRKTLSHYYCL